MGRAWEAILSGEHLVILEDLESALGHRFPAPFDVSDWNGEITTDGGYNSSIIGIRLTGFDFSKLPASFWKLSTLERLQISGNHSLTHLEDRFGELENLESLIITRSSISSLPNSFFTLKKLKVLDLSSNQFEEIPALIEQLNSLETLKLRGNKLHEIPPILFQSLKTLTTLEIDHNSLSKISKLIYKLKHLKKFIYLPQTTKDSESNEINVQLPNGFEDWLTEIQARSKPLPQPHFFEVLENNENIAVAAKGILPTAIILAKLSKDSIHFCSEADDGLYQISRFQYSSGKITEVGQFSAKRYSVRFAVSNDGDRYLVQSFNKDTSEYDILLFEKENSSKKITSLKKDVLDIKFIPNTEKILLLTQEMPLKIIDLSTKEILELEKNTSDYRKPSSPTCIQVSSDGKILLVGYSNGVVQAYDLSTLKFLYATDFEGDSKFITFLEFHPSLRTFTASDDHGRTFARKTKDGHYSDKVFRTGVVSHITFSNDGKYTLTFNTKKELIAYYSDATPFVQLNSTEEILLLSSNEESNFIILRSGEWVQWKFKQPPLEGISKQDSDVLREIEKANLFQLLPNRIKVPQSEQYRAVDGKLTELFITVSTDHDIAAKTLSQLGKLSSVEKLLLVFPKTKQIPDEIRDLTNAISLELHFTDLEDVPIALSTLQNIKKVEINNREFGSLPRNLKHLSQVEKFTFNTDQLSEELGDLTHVKEMMIRGSYKKGFEKIPNSINRLSNLQVLTLSSRNLVLFPNTFGELRSLERLYIQGANKLKSIPVVIGNLKNLTNLFITAFYVNEIPSSIGKLENLIHFSIECNGLKAIPNELANCINLQHLRLQANCEEYPPSLGNLTNLKSLMLQLQSTTIPEFVSKFSKLEDLTIYSYTLDTLPDWWDKLPNLKSIAIIRLRNKLKPVKSLMQLKNLEKISNIFDLSEPIDSSLVDWIKQRLRK